MSMGVKRPTKHHTSVLLFYISFSFAWPSGSARTSFRYRGTLKGGTLYGLRDGRPGRHMDLALMEKGPGSCAFGQLKGI